MTRTHPRTCTVFERQRRVATGPLAEVALIVKRLTRSDAGAALLVFDDDTGRVIDIDTRGTDQQIVERLATLPGDPSGDESPQNPSRPQSPRGRGRPRLGVVAREVTLLPRHWEWLAAQPGGASVALRKLVDAARHDHAGQDLRQSREAAYRFMSAMAGDLPGFEEAIRALFAGDRQRMAQCMEPWPGDVVDYAMKLAGAADVNPPVHVHADVHGPGPHLRSL